MATLGTFDVVGLQRHVTMEVHLKRVRELRFRLWIGRHLIALAARILNNNVQFLED